MKNKFTQLIKINLILVYLVIAAGAIVRMTGSGMGCPDWPKCFGYLIPPTERSQLDWHPQHPYHKNEVIIVGESLRVALSDFTSGPSYNPNNWAPYTKHDYALFNPVHTWIEFINRLLGALAGLGTLILFVFTLFQQKTKPLNRLWSTLILFGMAFQAWLGKTVVDSNLLPLKITLHMAMALVLVALLVLLNHQNKPNDGPVYPKSMSRLALAALVLTLVQIALGTQVRQFVDLQMHQAASNPENWLLAAPLKFYIHRSFSILVLGLHFYMAYLLRKAQLLTATFKNILSLILANILTGIAMYYIDFPWGSQPLHLVLSALLFGAQFYFLLLCYARKKQP
ncbi:MAG: COX15/CtaA family protein [Flavobacteriaceae bacterium]